MVRLAQSDDAAECASSIQRGLVRITSVPVEYLTPLIEDRAVAVQAALANQGQHRAPSIPDLLIAATPNGPGSPSFTSTRITRSSPISGQPVERLKLP